MGCSSDTATSRIPCPCSRWLRDLLVLSWPWEGVLPTGHTVGHALLRVLLFLVWWCPCAHYSHTSPCPPPHSVFAFPVVPAGAPPATPAGQVALEASCSPGCPETHLGNFTPSCVLSGLIVSRFDGADLPGSRSERCTTHGTSETLQSANDVLPINLHA